ncbi:uncharacterized protein LOC110721753 [Chenopodium quinoa]|uniref:uncharacterized protein LOC110721753 n=1 Tax=Chenopodium quinoa TaxID=63459 RepID=UPI000B770CA9|nr:uncharacterized protein LOC110721753 [Chenopodium quinoa]
MEKAEDPDKYVPPEIIKCIEETLSQHDYKYIDRSTKGISLNKGLLPHKFSTTDIPKFKPTDNPYFNLKAFETVMDIKGANKQLFPLFFHLSLEPVCQQWFFSGFQGHCYLGEHCLTEFYNMWKEVSARMIKAPDGKKSVRMFVRNFQEKYQEYLKYQLLNTFKAVYNIGIEIEDDLMKLAAANNNNAKGKRNDHPSSSSPINEVHSIDTPKKQIQRSKRVFTALGMSYETAFDKLHHKGLVMPIGPIKDPVPEARPPKQDPNKHCKYHQGKGHDTEECWKLK